MALLVCRDLAEPATVGGRGTVGTLAGDGLEALRPLGEARDDRLGLAGRLVGYAIGGRIDARLAVAALRRAIELRRPLPGCVFHSDRGSQYASEKHRSLLVEHGLVGSMSRRGNPYDNPQAESFIKTLKVEAVYLLEYETYEDVVTDLPVGDFCAGLYAAYAITAALLRARDTGEGAWIDCSMLGALIGVAALQTSEFFGTGIAPRRLGSAHPRNAPYQAFAASDEHFVIAAGNDRLWREVAEAAGLPEIATDPRFATQSARARNQTALIGLLAPRFAERTAGEWLHEMDRRGVPSAPINSYDQILSDPHVETMDLVRRLRLPNGAETRTTAFPVAITGFEFELYGPPPRLGEHTDEIFQEWCERADAKPTRGN